MLSITICYGETFILNNFIPLGGKIVSIDYILKSRGHNTILGLNFKYLFLCLLLEKGS